MQFALKDIQANPFRRIEHYPLRRDKILALRESLRTTGYWGNVVARLNGGKPQIAYGHHRLQALREEYKPDQHFDLIIQDLDDEAMIKIMARENMEEWGTSAAVEQETVRATVEAFAEGRIELETVDLIGSNHLGVRYAPSFIANGKIPETLAATSRQVAYTATTLARFIGWTLDGSNPPQPKERVYHALAALELIEQGYVKDSDFRGLNNSQARALVEQANKVRKDREAAAKYHRGQAAKAERERQREEERERQAREEHERQLERESEQRRVAAKARREREQREAEAAAARKREKEAATARERQRAETARKKAEKDAAERRAREAEAEAKRKRAQFEAEEAERERKAAAERQAKAKREREASEKQAKQQMAAGKKASQEVGKEIGIRLRAGDIGFREAGSVTAEIMGKTAKGETPPADIQKFKQQLMVGIARIFDPDGDRDRVEKLRELIKWRGYLGRASSEDAARTLNSLAERVMHYARELRQPISQAAARKLPQPIWIKEPLAK